MRRHGIAPAPPPPPPRLRPRDERVDAAAERASASVPAASAESPSGSSAARTEAAARASPSRTPSSFPSTPPPGHSARPSPLERATSARTTCATSARSLWRHSISAPSSPATPASAHPRSSAPRARDAASSADHTWRCSSNAAVSLGDQSCVPTSASTKGVTNPGTSQVPSHGSEVAASSSDGAANAATSAAAFSAFHPASGARTAAAAAAAASGLLPSHPSTSAASRAHGATSQPYVPCSVAASRAAEAASHPPPGARRPHAAAGPSAGPEARATPPPPRPATPRRLRALTAPTTLLFASLPRRRARRRTRAVESASTPASTASSDSEADEDGADDEGDAGRPRAASPNPRSRRGAASFAAPVSSRSPEPSSAGSSRIARSAAEMSLTGHPVFARAFESPRSRASESLGYSARARAAENPSASPSASPPSSPLPAVPPAASAAASSAHPSTAVSPCSPFPRSQSVAGNARGNNALASARDQPSVVASAADDGADGRRAARAATPPSPHSSSARSATCSTRAMVTRCPRESASECDDTERASACCAVWIHHIRSPTSRVDQPWVSARPRANTAWSEAPSAPATPSATRVAHSNAASASGSHQGALSESR